MPANTPKIKVSYEIIPAKNDNQQLEVIKCVEALAHDNPSFIAVRCGREDIKNKRTFNTVLHLKKHSSVPVMAHLTCAGVAQSVIHQRAQDYRDAGIKNIFAVRGDRSIGADDNFFAFDHACDLVKTLKEIADFEISVAGYPEGHPESPDIDQDIENLKHKINCGADRIITQFGFNPQSFLSWRDKVRKAGINVPIIAGVLPIHCIRKIQNLAKMCGVSIPENVKENFTKTFMQHETSDQMAITIAYNYCKFLQDNGIEDFHFFTMDKPGLSRTVSQKLKGV